MKTGHKTGNKPSRRARGRAPLDSAGGPASGPPALPPGMTVGDAFEATIAALDVRLGDMVRLFLETAPGPASVDAVHQARVAERRLRAALDAWKGLPRRKESKRFKKELKWLHGRFGPVRDLDVFRAEMLGPLIARYGNDRSSGARGAGLARLAADVDAARARAAKKAARSLATLRYGRLTGRLARWAAGGWPVRAGADPDMPVEVFAARALEKAHARVVGAIADARGRPGNTGEEDGGAAFHAVRIEIKKLRYAAQFFSTTFPGRATASWIAALTRLQDTLGTMQDAEAVAQTAHGLTRKRGRALHDAGELAVREARKSRRKALRRVQGLTDRFLEMTPFWR